MQTDELPTFIPSDSSDSSADSTCKNSVYISNFSTANTSASLKVQSSSANFPNFYDFTSRLPPRFYPEKAIQNKVPPQVRCIPVSESVVWSNQLTSSKKRDVINDSCQRKRNFQISSVVHKNPYVLNTYTTFRHSAQSTPPGYTERQKEVKKRYPPTIFQKHLSKHKDVNAVIESSVHPKFCFSQLNILTATTCKAHCVSSDFDIGKNLPLR